MPSSDHQSSNKSVTENQPTELKVYLVGGAVRDECLGLTTRDRDWVVVGATPQAMQDLGYRPVGRDFPVFLHPQTHEEYALARTERKQGHGYRGFVTDYDTSVTLEDDLRRRDLTINAMAKDRDGRIIDPYGGQHDLQRRILRHVSPAFLEDPLRVLRVARFAARYHQLGFQVADETQDLMRQITASGELAYLARERVWQEVQRALMEDHPSTFFQVLHEVGALNVLLPELAVLDGIPQNPQYHPEVDTWLHTRMVLDLCASEQLPGEARFAALTHDLGKGLTPRTAWPKHLHHERLGLSAVHQVCERLCCPRAYRQLAELVCRWHLVVHQALQLRPGTMLKLFEATGAFRQPQQFSLLLHICACDARGRLGRTQEPYPQAAYLQSAFERVQHVDTQPFLDLGLSGNAVGEAIRKERLKRLTQYRRDYQRQATHDTGTVSSTVDHKP